MARRNSRDLHYVERWIEPAARHFHSRFENGVVVPRTEKRWSSTRKVMTAELFILPIRMDRTRRSFPFSPEIWIGHSTAKRSFINSEKKIQIFTFITC